MKKYTLHTDTIEHFHANTDRQAIMYAEARTEATQNYTTENAMQSTYISSKYELYKDDKLIRSKEYNHRSAKDSREQPPPKVFFIRKKPSKKQKAM